MKSLLLPAFFLAALSLTSAYSTLDLAEWEHFKTTHGRQYGSSEEEEKRLNIFMDNLRFIEEHNEMYRRGEISYYVAVNQFADLTSQERVSRMNGYKRPAGLARTGTPFQIPEGLKTSSRLDWRKKGAVTAIKNQGNCGSCWAFSATGSLEGQHFLNTGELVSLSEQNLLDCSKANEGCNGGWVDKAFAYIESNGGIDTETSYPYLTEVGSCEFNSSNVGATCSGYVDISYGNLTELLAAVTSVGPVSVAIDATSSGFGYYKGGVFKDTTCSTTYLDHAVLVVGYGHSLFHGKYWIVKNSWGTDWGEKGYIRMTMDYNVCGIASEASYPTV